jgi:hypothetical protein
MSLAISTAFIHEAIIPKQRVVPLERKNKKFYSLMSFAKDQKLLWELRHDITVLRI